MERDSFDIWIDNECIARDVDIDLAPNFLMTLALKYKPQLIETGCKVSLTFHKEPVKEDRDAENSGSAQV